MADLLPPMMTPSRHLFSRSAVLPEDPVGTAPPRHGVRPAGARRGGAPTGTVLRFASMPTDRLFGPPDLAPVTRGLVAATLVTTALLALVGPEVVRWVAHPHPALPWTLVVATLHNPVPLWMVASLVALGLAGPYFDGSLHPGEFAGLYLGCGAAGHAAASVVLGFPEGGWVPATGFGGMFGTAALLAGYAHFSGREVVHLHGGLLRFELRHGILLAIAYELAQVAAFGPAAAGSAGRAAAALSATVYLRRHDLFPTPAFAAA